MTAEAIVARGLTKVYGRLTAVDHVDLTVATGGIFGLLGPNGAGKTTIIKMLTGLSEITSGMRPSPGSTSGNSRCTPSSTSVGSRRR